MPTVCSRTESRDRDGHCTHVSSGARCLLSFLLVSNHVRPRDAHHLTESAREREHWLEMRPQSKRTRQVCPRARGCSYYSHRARFDPEWRHFSAHQARRISVSTWARQESLAEHSVPDLWAQTRVMNAAPRPVALTRNAARSDIVIAKCYRRRPTCV